MLTRFYFLPLCMSALLASGTFAQENAPQLPMCDLTDGFGKSIKVPCDELLETDTGDEHTQQGHSSSDETSLEDRGAQKPQPNTAPQPLDQSVPAPDLAPVISSQKDEQTPTHHSGANVDLETVIALIAEQVTQKVSADIDAKLEQLALPDIASSGATQEELTSEANARSKGFTTPVTGKPGGRVEMVFGQGIPTLICAPMQQCIIELEDGEVLSDVTALSETSRWDKFLRHRQSGTLKTIIGLKPHYDAEPAVLSFLTDRRLYVIRLIPSLYDNTYVLSFTYPDTQKRIEAERIAQLQAVKSARETAKHNEQLAVLAKTGVQNTTGAYVPARNREWASSIRGNAPFKPVRVSWDQKYTYIELPQNYRGDIPGIDIPAGQASPVITVDPENPKRLILDQVIKTFKLSLGRKSVSIAP